MDVPHFPRELEREILEIVAETGPHEVPKLLLVARRVHLWLEPLLYRSICLSFSPKRGRETDAQEAFLNAASSKSSSFLARAVRRVAIDCSYEKRHPELVLRFTEALKHCTGIIYLLINRSTSDSAAEMFSALDAGRTLSCLSAFLADLMPTRTPMDALQPIFRSLTHLTVLDLETDPRFLPFLTTLPVLTHLALKRHIDPRIWSALLKRDACMHLQILVWLIMHSRDPHLQIYEQWANDAGRSVQDPRVVVTVFDMQIDWFSEPVQGPAYWHEAEIFIQKKKSGLIPNDCYWTGDFHATRDSHLSGTIL